MRDSSRIAGRGHPPVNQLADVIKSMTGIVLLVCAALLISVRAWATEFVDVDKYDTDAALTFDRTKFGGSAGDGEAGFAIWSPLTDFEARVLTQRKALKQNHVDAMLALYLIASGDVRTGTEFKRVRSSFLAWIKQTKPTIDSTSDQEERAQLLYQAMHRHFFPKNTSTSDVPSGYDPDQSKLSTIFRTGKYNCISSTMLYILASEAFGIKAQGVVLPSHTFVQLDLDKGNHIEVETTIAKGFNVLHNKAYYDFNAKQLSHALQLAPTTWEEYQRRTIVSPLQLGLLDMGSQHTSPQKMSYTDRMRLAEIRSYFAPNNLSAQLNRLYYYQSEFNFFARKQDHANMSRLIHSIAPWLMSRTINDFKSPTWRSELATMKTHMAYGWIKTHREDAGLALSRKLIKTLPPGLDNYDMLQDALYTNIAEFVVTTTLQRNYTRARQALRGYEHECIKHANCDTSLAMLYSHWSQSYWQHKDWQQVISTISDYLKLDKSGKNSGTFQENLESAYLNLANEYIQNKDRRRSERALSDCVNRISTAVRCQAALQTLKTHSMF